jgi:hypothetical protein
MDGVAGGLHTHRQTVHREAFNLWAFSRFCSSKDKDEETFLFQSLATLLIPNGAEPEYSNVPLVRRGRLTSTMETQQSL